MKGFLVSIIAISSFIFSLSAQYIVEDVANVAIYEFLDEMAGEKLIQINSAVKPYSKQFISDKLLELEGMRNRLNHRQQQSLTFFMQNYSLERNELPSDTHWNIIDKNDISLAILPPAFYYKDTLFRAKINPILGVTVEHNGNEPVISVIGEVNFKAWWATISLYMEV